ncbi:hypothetical protein [Hymenobacter wooponensis]|uniref:Lipoprotein n=1 Tax=Hymenobacter wooponensis TaxID=1525360 RepID=A0A4Z0MTC3_9BACT|nr:hypothetical protein [Hymenobacter wooponensis]TGD82884.1 hypothetical protein EU557_03630 [Hymenobacter wooponensis]
MAHTSTFALTMLLAGTLLTSACDKQSDVAPSQPSAKATKAILLPGQLSPVAIGQYWNHGPEVTGLQCYAPAKLVSSRITDNVQVDTYEGKVVDCIPAERLVYNTTYTVQTQPELAVIRCHTVTETDGTITIRANYNMNASR